MLLAGLLLLLLWMVLVPSATRHAGVRVICLVALLLQSSSYLGFLQ
jgi:hypothetical protein